MTANTILCGDAAATLRTLPAESVHMIVTSPPFWNQRDYSVDGQIGLEPSPADWITRLVDVFREARRVLRRDGTAWIEIGDTYSTQPTCGPGLNSGLTKPKNGERKIQIAQRASQRGGLARLPRKSICGLPWRLAFALQDDGWLFRQDIIWLHTNCVPESVRDRCTKAHSYLFMFTRRPHYYWDQVALMEPVSGGAHERGHGITPKSCPPSTAWARGAGAHDAVSFSAVRSKQNVSFSGAVRSLVTMRNKRSVWPIASEPLSDAHYAAYPQELPATCIMASTSARGVCATCAAPWTWIVKRERAAVTGTYGGKYGKADREVVSGRTLLENVKAARAAGGEHDSPFTAPETLGWHPACAHAGEPVPATVLDPFMGAGTTALAALQLGRHYLGIELSCEYVALANRRLQRELPLFAPK